MTIELRLYEKSDGESVKKLFEEFVEYHSRIDSCFEKIEKHDECFIEYIESAEAADDQFCIVAVQDGEVAGYCRCAVEQKPPIYPKPSFGYIDNLCVSERHQRKGIGTLLVRDAVARFKAKGIERVECFYALGNPKSKAFWYKMDFKPFMEQMALAIE